jgi:hypothetical protein
MRRLFAAVAAWVLCAVAVGPVLAATETVTGTIVDQSCYLKDKANNAGVDHKMPADVKECALACAKKGRPMALLAADGKVYTIAGGLAADNNAKLVGHLGHKVAVTGDVVTKDGATTITAADLKMAAK